MSRQKQALLTKDQRHLKTAQGWIDLGDWLKAIKEVAKISARSQSNPDVLQTKWIINCMAGDWERAFAVAERVSKVLPDDPFGMCAMAYALHHMKRTEEALALEFAVTDKFPDHYLVLYNLAYHACQRGKLQEATTWIKRAFKSHKRLKLPSEMLRKMALEDPGMQPLWSYIRSM